MLNAEFRKLFRERALRFLCLAMLCALGVTSYLYAAGEKTAVTQAQYDAKMRGIMQTAQRNYEKQAANTTNPYLLSYNGQILDVYGSMPQVTVTEEEVYTPEEWMTSQIPDLYCCALLALLVPVLFLSETNHRTAPVLLATVGGRRRLARTKILLLLFLTFGTVLAADAVSLCGTVLHCGMPDFSVSVQTMPAFVLCPLVMPAWARKS